MNASVIKLLGFFDRSVYYLAGTRPAVFYLVDREGGGILVNTPAFSHELAQNLAALAPVNYLYYPSHLGAADVDAWRAATGARAMAHGAEADQIAGTTDIVLGREARFSRTMDFLPMSGRTGGSCALRCKNKPGVVFFGPILACGAGGWPRLIPGEDDHSFENRLIGALGLKDLKYEYAFTDDFVPGASLYGPGAAQAVAAEIEAAFAG